MENANKRYELKIEKKYKQPVADVFKAISEGRIFQNCGADTETMKIDFKKGGKYALTWKRYDIENDGEFLEIIPNKKIVFTWHGHVEATEPDTLVTIELFEESGGTRLVLVHTGFKTKDMCDQHHGGWSSGINDLADEMEQGKVRLVRGFELSVEKLFEACKTPALFFGIMGDTQKGVLDFKVGGKYHIPTSKNEIKGEFLEIIPNKKISFTWKSAPCGENLTRDTKVTLNFEAEDDGSSSLELVHELLENQEVVKSHRYGWEMVTAAMLAKLQS